MEIQLQKSGTVFGSTDQTNTLLLLIEESCTTWDQRVQDFFHQQYHFKNNLLIFWNASLDKRLSSTKCLVSNLFGKCSPSHAVLLATHLHIVASTKVRQPQVESSLVLDYRYTIGHGFHHFRQKFSTKIYDPPRSLGLGEKKTPKAHHGFAVRSKLTLDQLRPSYGCVTWLTQPHCFFLGREKYDGGGLF